MPKISKNFIIWSLLIWCLIWCLICLIISFMFLCEIEGLTFCIKNPQQNWTVLKEWNESVKDINTINCMRVFNNDTNKTLESGCAMSIGDLYVGLENAYKYFKEKFPEDPIDFELYDKDLTIENQKHLVLEGLDCNETLEYISLDCSGGHEVRAGCNVTVLGLETCRDYFQPYLNYQYKTSCQECRLNGEEVDCEDYLNKPIVDTLDEHHINCPSCYPRELEPNKTIVIRSA